MAIKSLQSKYTGEITLHNDLPHLSPDKQWYTGKVKVYLVTFSGSQKGFVSFIHVFSEFVTWFEFT